MNSIKQLSGGVAAVFLHSIRLHTLAEKAVGVAWNDNLGVERTSFHPADNSQFPCRVPTRRPALAANFI